MHRRVHQAARVTVMAAAVTATLAAQATPSSAVWATALTGGSKGLVASGIPSAPTGQVAACNGGTGPARTMVKVGWNPAAQATSYTILQSANTGGAPYTSVGTTTGTTWTSTSLSSGSFTFRIEAVRSGWRSAPTAATATRDHQQQRLLLPLPEAEVAGGCGKKRRGWTQAAVANWGSTRASRVPQPSRVNSCHGRRPGPQSGPP